MVSCGPGKRYEKMIRFILDHDLDKLNDCISIPNAVDQLNGLPVLSVENVHAMRMLLDGDQ